MLKQTPKRTSNHMFRRAQSLLILQQALAHAYALGAIEDDKDVLDVAHNVKK